ncbi:MAG: hypothetical protein R2568_07975 [Candidatus Scalindua sp.]|jgi:hypothetical protein|nr:hypothetical protein [Candidatus Scalindua sp.]MDV5166673.1 hypothetical protein [Candidatus Scalindua sp.]
MSSRNEEDLVYTGDLVYFISTASNSLTDLKYLSGVKTYDPLQRLVPHPDKPTYLTTRAGVWAAWTFEKEN